jgi:nucleoside phosphorylase
MAFIRHRPLPRPLEPSKSNAEGSEDMIDVVIITIREDENKAVLDRLVGRRLIYGKNRTYVGGVVDSAEGVQYTVAVIRTLEQGPNAANDTTRDAIEDLDPRLIVVAGIAGAVPDSEFTLGDVVIATRLHDFTVAAFKEGEPPSFTNQGGPMKKVIQDLAVLLTGVDFLAGWNAKDRIRAVRPDVDLSEARFYGNDDWKKETRSRLDRFFSSAGHRTDPIFTTRAIASSGSLIKDTGILQIWREASRDVAAVEMELSGVYAGARRRDKEYPVLAIRGISDVVGFKRSPEWTAYACHTAAAFCVALLANLPAKLLPAR